MYLRSTISDVASAVQDSNLPVQVWRTRTDKRKLSSLNSHLVTQHKQCPALKALSFFLKDNDGPRSTMSTTVTGQSNAVYNCTVKLILLKRFLVH